MLITSAAISPPTITIANGRCESEPMPCDVAAGSKPKRRHQHGHHDRAEPQHRAFLAASTIVWPRARNWLMYSTMITPVCTETPNSARNPTPEDTLKLVPRQIAAPAMPPTGAIATFTRIRLAHFIDPNIEYRIMKISSSVSGMMSISRFWARCWLSYSPAQSM